MRLCNIKLHKRKKLYIHLKADNFRICHQTASIEKTGFFDRLGG